MSNFSAGASAALGRMPSKRWANLPGVVRGLALAGVVALLSIELAKLEVLRSNGISPLTLSIVLGMIAGNTIYPRLSEAVSPGVTFAKQRLLRWGIVLYGLRLTFQDIAHVGLVGVAIDALVLCSTFGLACALGTRLFGLDRRTSMLIGAGSSICGAAAVMATEPVVRGRSEDVAVAVSTVVVFGTLAMFLYPALYQLNLDLHLVPMAHREFGLFAGSTIHEVAQVVAAGNAVGENAANIAVITKMVRVMMLAPFLIGLSAWLARPKRDDVAASKVRPMERGRLSDRIALPWFALAFVLVVGLNSLSLLPHAVLDLALEVDTGMMATAMAALGLTTHVSAIRRAGLGPLGLAALLFAWLLCGGLMINVGLGHLLG